MSSVVMQPSPAERHPDPAMRINFLDPTVPFGEGAKPVISSITAEETEDSFVIVNDQLDDAVGLSVHALRQARHRMSGMVEPTGQTDPDNPLAYTERELGVTAAWAEEDVERKVTSAIERTERAEDEREAHESDVADQDSLNTNIRWPRWRKAAAALMAFATSGGGGLATEATTAMAYSGKIQQNCVKLPKVLDARIFAPGKGGQSWFLKEKYPRLSEEDCGDIKRLVQIRTELRRHGRWFATRPWEPIIGFIEHSPKETRDGPITATQTDTHSNKLDGPRAKVRRGDRARFKIRVQAKDVDTGKVRGQKIGIHRVGIRR